MFRFLILIGVSALTACSNAPMKSKASTQFAPCPSAPHCVSSLETGSKHIAAISVNSAQEWQRLQATLLAMPRTEAIERQANTSTRSATVQLCATKMILNCAIARTKIASMCAAHHALATTTLRLIANALKHCANSLMPRPPLKARSAADNAAETSQFPA